MRRLVVLAVLAAMCSVMIPTAPAAAEPGVIEVTTTADVRQPGLSLRRAINIAVADGVVTTIQLQPGHVYVLNQCAAVSEDNNASGDLDVRAHDDGLIIDGAGSTIRQDCAGERVLDLASHNVKLWNMRITGGEATIDAGDANGDGGGVRSTAGRFVYGFGGQLSGDPDDLRLDHVVVAGNTAAGDGGGVSGRQPGFLPAARRRSIEVRLVASEVSGNTSGGEGGGVSSHRLYLERSSVVENEAAAAGGVRASIGVFATDSTVADSTATGGSASDGVEISADFQVALRRSTVRGGTGAGPPLHGGHSLTNLYESVIAQGGTSAACLVNNGEHHSGSSADDDGSCPLDAEGDQSDVADLGLVPLGSFGGPTRSIRPLPTSPLVDAAGACQQKDQRGRTRPGGSACDIGAVELTGLPNGLLRLGSSGPFSTRDVLTVRPQVGQTANITLRLVNDGDLDDHLHVQGPGSSRWFTVTYERSHADVTADVVAGDYSTPERTPGAADTLVLRLTPKPGAPVGTARTLVVHVTSATSPSATDTLTVNARVSA